MDIQDITHPMTGPAEVIDSDSPKGCSGQNIQIPSRTALQEHCMGHGKHAHGRQCVMLPLFFGKCTQCNGPGYIRGGTQVLPSGIHQKKSLRLQGCMVLLGGLIMHHGPIGTVTGNGRKG